MRPMMKLKSQLEEVESLYCGCQYTARRKLYADEWNLRHTLRAKAAWENF